MHLKVRIKGTVAQEKEVQLRPWGDGLDPNHRLHLGFTLS